MAVRAIPGRSARGRSRGRGELGLVARWKGFVVRIRALTAALGLAAVVSACPPQPDPEPEPPLPQEDPDEPLDAPDR
jgi:hypothetical protein